MRLRPFKEHLTFVVLNFEPWLKVGYISNAVDKKIFLIAREWTGLFGFLDFKKK
jgi:hypothetical protein